MTIDEFEEWVRKLVEDGREVGMSDDTMLSVLEDAVKALREGLS